MPVIDTESPSTFFLFH
uniref:Uncharacterized protein n=1 Tax=Arundo donax TaxID=35708 RepID=A0A0A9Q0J3_ARUDO